MIYQIYRRVMRTFARFILGFDSCPTSYRKNYRKIAVNALSAAILCIIIITLLGVLAISC